MCRKLVPKMVVEMDGLLGEVVSTHSECRITESRFCSGMEMNDNGQHAAKAPSLDPNHSCRKNIESPQQVFCFRRRH